MTASEKDLEIARHIKLARRKSGLTQQQLASKLNIASQQVQKYESGENRITAARLWKVSEILDQPIESFFKGLERIDDKPPENQADRKTATLQGLLNQIDDEDVKDAIITVIESYLAQNG